MPKGEAGFRRAPLWVDPVPWIPAFAGMTTIRTRIPGIVIPAKAGIHFYCLNCADLPSCVAANATVRYTKWANLE